MCLCTPTCLRWVSVLRALGVVGRAVLAQFLRGRGPGSCARLFRCVPRGDVGRPGEFSPSARPHHTRTAKL